MLPLPVVPEAGQDWGVLKMPQGWHGAPRVIKSIPDLRSLALAALAVSKVDLDTNRVYTRGADSNVLRAVTIRGITNFAKGPGLSGLYIGQLPPENERGARWKILR